MKDLVLFEPRNAYYTPQQNYQNNGLDFFGRKIEVGDIVARIHNFSGGASVFETVRISSLHKNGKTVRFKPSEAYDYEEPLRYSGRTIILQRGDGRPLEPLS